MRIKTIAKVLRENKNRIDSLVKKFPEYLILIQYYDSCIVIEDYFYKFDDRYHIEITTYKNQKFVHFHTNELREFETILENMDISFLLLSLGHYNVN